MKKLTLTTALLASLLALCACGGSNGGGEPQQSGYQFDDVSNEDGSMSYEIFVRSFYDSDGDTIGDLNGVKSKIPYLADLGIKTVWLMPIHKSPTYHGYDVNDYYSVNPDYGTLQEFDDLVLEAKNYNIDIMLDMVFNHSSNKCDYYTTALEDYKNNNQSATSKKDWYCFSRESKDGYVSVGGGIYVEARFSGSMPEFNLDCQGVRDEMENITKFWIEHGVKGFRLDAVYYYYFANKDKNVEFLTWLEQTAHKYDPNFYMVGECWNSDNDVINYHASECDSFFNFGSAVKGDGETIVGTVKGAASVDYFAKYIQNTESKIKAKNPNSYSSYFISNHDQDRASKFLTNEDQYKAAASLYCLLPGTPFMYYGEEIALKGYRGSEPTDANRRLPLIWSSETTQGQCGYPEPKYASKMITQVTVGVEDQLKDGWSLLNHYKKVINVRNKYSFFKMGIFTNMTSELGGENKRVMAYKISLGNEYVVVIHNLSAESATVNSIGTEILDSIDTAKVAPALNNGKVTLGAYSTVLVK
jgi:alpha-amylase